MTSFPITIFHPDSISSIASEVEFQHFSKEYTLIHAAGGIIRNPNKQILMIYRHQLWDFPKGKVEVGEQLTDTAIREVKEETGIADICLQAPLPNTFHTYRINDMLILKETHWFAMTSSCTSFTPQTDENITRVEWIPFLQVNNLLQNSYPSLLHLWHKISSHYD